MLVMGSVAAAWIGGGTLYGNGNLAATAGFSNNMSKILIKKNNIELKQKYLNQKTHNTHNKSFNYFT